MSSTPKPAVKSNVIVGVDVGGTFTDLFVLDWGDHPQAHIIKVPSTRGQEAQGFMRGVKAVHDALHPKGEHEQPRGLAASITTLVHGTTVATNALLERKVAKTGLITTRGFRDVLEMRRRDRAQTWGLKGSFVPIIPRDLRLEVDERVLASGEIHTEVNIEQVRTQAQHLLAQGCEAICVFFINAYANPLNELRAKACIEEFWPNAHVSVATQVLPEIREFERCSTASLNAALQPVVGGYLSSLESALGQEGFLGELLIVQSNGGVMSASTAGEFPVRTALSGPAAGVIACAEIAKVAGFPNVITGDMGGTSFDVSLVAQGQAALASQTAIEFGLVVRSPMIQIETIGAGGGSIAWVDTSGMLQIGPESAGSNPGPACYGRGNKRATVTDANVLLGRIAAHRPLGGGGLKPLSVELAREAVESSVATPLGLDVYRAADAILTLANAKMAGTIRLVSIERGHDPRLFVYMPFGGGGALHVCALMREVGVSVGLIPRYPGVTSALGCVLSDMKHDAVQTLNKGLADLDIADLQEKVARLRQLCQARLDASGIVFTRIVETVVLDMLYQGQTHTVAVPIEADDYSHEGLLKAFERTYHAQFGRTLSGPAVRVLNLRYSRVGERAKFDLSILAPQSKVVPEVLGHERIFHQGEWLSVPRSARLDWPVGSKVVGPAMLEQADTTIWLEPGFQARVDEWGNLLLSRGETPA